MERAGEMRTGVFDPTYYKCVFWLMAVFRHDKRRQIVSQNNFADIATIFTTEITIFQQ